MNKKRWFYLIFLTLVFIMFFIRPVFKLFYSNSFSDSLSFFYAFDSNPILQSIKSFLELNALNYIFSFLGIDNVSSTVLKIIFTLFGYLFSFLSLYIYKGFFEQAERCIHREKGNIVKAGILCYGIFTLVIIIFVFSIIGYGISAFFLFLLILIVMVGKISVGMYLGNKMINKDNIFINMFFGMIIIDILKFIPYAGIIIDNVFVPMLSLGVIVQNIYNMFVLKIYYEESISVNEKNMFNKGEIYDIIISDRKERDGK